MCSAGFKGTKPPARIGFLAVRFRSGVQRGSRPFAGFGGSPHNSFSLFCSPPQAARKKKEKMWGHPKPRQEAMPSAPPKNLLLRARGVPATFFLSSRAAAGGVQMKEKKYLGTTQAPPGGCRPLDPRFCERLFQTFGMTHSSCVVVSFASIPEYMIKINIKYPKVRTKHAVHLYFKVIGCQMKPVPSYSWHAQRLQARRQLAGSCCHASG